MTHWRPSALLQEQRAIVDALRLGVFRAETKDFFFIAVLPHIIIKFIAWFLLVKRGYDTDDDT